jgi:oligosaccharide repeat unit polymerase
MGLIVILSLVTISGLSYARLRDPLYPPFIHSALWAFIITLYELFRPAIVDLPGVAYIIVLSGALTFAAGSYWATYGIVRDTAATKPDKLPNPLVGEILLLVSVVGLYFFVMRAIAIAAQGPFDNFLVNIRYVTGGNSFVDEDPLEGFGPVAYLVSLSVVALGVQFLLREYYGTRWRYYLSLLAASAYAVLTTGRTFIMIVAMLVLGLNLLTGKISAKRGASILFIVGAVSFTIMGIALGKGGGSGVEVVMDQFRIYLLGGLAAFGQHIQETQLMDWGTNIMRTPLLVLRYVGIEVPVPALMKEYRFIPDPTNVYTFYLPYFDDFGYVGAFFAPFMIGFMQGKVYKRARMGSSPFMIFYALLLYPLFMQFFQDQYFSLMSTWVQYTGWTLVAFLGGRILVAQAREQPAPSPAGG